MKTYLTIFSSLTIFFFSVFAQNSTNEGYFSNPVETPYGIITTNEFENAIYLITNGEIQTLLEAPGCGRYMSFSKEKNLIGFKFIDKTTRMQAPAILNLETKEATKLSAETEQAGQVSFSLDGTIAYSIGKVLYIQKGGITKTYDLGIYSNRTPISPDGNAVIFKDDGDQLYIYNLETKTSEKMTDGEKGYANAVWSLDGKFVAYTTNGVEIYTRDLTKKQTYFIGEGEEPKWSPDGKYIVYHKKDIDFYNVSLINSDIYISSADGKSVYNLTNTENIFELDASFTENSQLIYHTHNAKEIIKADFIIDNSVSKKITRSILYKANEPLQLNFFSEPLAPNKALKSSSIDWVHIHQVYDTRDGGGWDQGRVCCGAATAAQILATYGIYTPWPMTTYSHISNFGKYISDVYTYNSITYTGFTGRWPSGGHGYLWNGGGSPYSNIVNFLKNHGITNCARKDNPSWNDVAFEIDNGFSYYVCSTGLTSGHIVLIVNRYTTSHTVYANDPYGDKNAGSYGYVQNGKNAIYDWSDANTGHVKITPVVWSVYARFAPNKTPEIISFEPTGTDSIPAFSTVSIKFNAQMNIASVENAFSINPNVEGVFTWSNYNQDLKFTPNVSLLKATNYTVTIDTSAKTTWGVKLEDVFSSSFTTKNRDKLSLMDYYPQKNREQMSLTTQFQFQFDGIVPQSSIVGNVHFYNQQDEKLTLTGLKLTYTEGKTLMVFEPKNAMFPNQNYRLVLYGSIKDSESYPLIDTLEIIFKTEVETIEKGIVIDAFEAEGGWQQPKISPRSINIDTINSKFATSTTRKYADARSGKFDFEFSSSSDGVCEFLNFDKPALTREENSIFGIWVFGDRSENLLSYIFTNDSDQIFEAIIDTINWTGWKFKGLTISDIALSGNKKFYGIAIKQIEDANISGLLYLDEAQYGATVGVCPQNDFQSPDCFTLLQNYPNPFNPATRINYNLPKDGFVALKVYDILGNEIAALINENQLQGNYSIEFNSAKYGLSSGVYFYRLQTEGFTQTKKMILAK